jgi:hypothetical protein
MPLFCGGTEKLMKKIICLLAAAMITAAAGGAVYAADREKAEPDVIVDGSKVLFDDQNAVIVDGVTLVPARGVFEAMGNTVKWYSDSNMAEITASTGVRYAQITIGKDTMKVFTYKTLMDLNNEEYTLEVPAQLINDRTMIPLRAVSEAFDCDVEWNEDDYVINITTTDPPLLEGYEHPPKTPDEEKVSLSLSTDAKDIKAGDEFDVYVETSNIPEGMYVSGLVAAMEFDKTALEYVGGSGTFLNDSDEPYEADVFEENAEFDIGTKIVFITITEEKARTKDGRIFKATFKALKDGPCSIALNYDFRSITGYESYPMFTTKEDSGLEFADIIYDGKDLLIDTTPIVIE